MKLEDLIAKRLGIGRRAARSQILEGLAEVDGVAEIDFRRDVTRYEEIRHDGKVVQESGERLYLMLNKPAGILSATRDPVHRTVVDLIDHPAKESLHLAGRLDRSSTGLVLLTNDGEWSAALSLPDHRVPKVYLVETDRPIPARAVELFAAGFDFPTEGITTLPATLEILSPRTARATLREGRYHQIKRMFHRIDGLRLVSLHRESIGGIVLPEVLPAGEWRHLHSEEIDFVSGR